MKVILIVLENSSYNELLTCLKRTLKELGMDYKVGSIKEAIIQLKNFGYLIYTTPINIEPDNLKFVEKTKFKVILSKNGVDSRIIKELAEFIEGEILHPIEVDKVIECNGVKIAVGKYLEKDRVFLLETKIDDVSGEVIAHAVEKVLKYALDVEVLLASGKKGRPCFVLRVISENVEKVAEIIMAETGSIGVRIFPIIRIKSPRKIETININVGNRQYSVRVKISGVNVKPEFEDIKNIAEKEGLSLIEAYRLVLQKLRVDT